MSSPNFGHLEEIEPALALLGAHAERYFVDDANTALIKTRQYAEQLTHVIAERSGVPRDADDNFAAMLSKVRADDLAPPEVLDFLHRLRIAGNDAVHGHSGERRAAFESIKICHRLGVWLRATVTRTANLTMPFVPPSSGQQEDKELQSQIAELEKKLEVHASAAERHRLALEDVRQHAVDAEERARLAEEERTVFEELALDAERRANQALDQPARMAFVQAAFASARDMEFDEADTRLLIDEQLRQAGWEADTKLLRHSAGTRPERNRNLAIAEWPTSSGPADYALFVGKTLVGVVEAKRERTNVLSALDVQATRYSQDIEVTGEFELAGGPWGDHKAPFLFASNGRSYYPAMKTQSGIWFRDTRVPTNGARALEGWITPEGLTERLQVDREAAEAELSGKPFNFGFDLRPYQEAAIRAVEDSLAKDRREMLVAMATGTGKTKLAIAMIYRLLEAKRFLRVCFVVDRSALGEQAETAFETTRMIGASTFADIFGLRKLGDADIDRDAKVHVCTVQSLVKRVLERDPGSRPPVDQYDLILIDECHRGYLLDREMSAAEATFRDENDYVSKYRRVVEYFDAVKIGLTATPALHTAQIFGEPIYRYSYREAVVDGWLIDHDPPHLITTALSVAGITFEAGETVEALDTRTGAIDVATLDDRLAFSVEHFNRKVLSPDFNRVVAEEIARHVDILDPNGGKTLIFAATDPHADEIVQHLREAYRRDGLEIEDGMILKITGSIDKPSRQILKFKNEANPRIAVTVDLLTTGIDVPAITNLVFLRRVNSRILYDQMIGRATRRCDEIGKEAFQIFDAVDLYPNLQSMTEMRPVVVNPSVSFEDLFAGFEASEDEGHRDEILDQIIVKLSRKIRKMNEEIRDQYTAQAGETPEETLRRFREHPSSEAREWTRERPGMGAFFDFEGARNAPPILPIAHHEDEVIRVRRGYGDGDRPDDFIDAFTAFVRDNKNHIAALNLVLTRPRDLTRNSLRELKLALDGAHFTENRLRTAWRDKTSEDVAASIIGFIRQAALGDPLVPFTERVDGAIRRVSARHRLDDAQRRWINRIGDEMKSRIVVDRDAFDEPPFAQQGGFRRLDRIFGGELEAILDEIRKETWETAA
ncbi:type I restriction-modification system endonuclease [Jannaschia sp. W003]|uniref:type I restriction-modification system endonuclease n=1 Tax=Jannaschia sp. W003 TaxID=2867012 RepID=UPI0021A6BDB3|nr:type I restriction-modification system endonuclease [Jannaschia sp. W003]UWQ20122.1 type I restriction-modification system endonuclease [Jannaschia sp. W003]